jgi:hypothetical protein
MGMDSDNMMEDNMMEEKEQPRDDQTDKITKMTVIPQLILENTLLVTG